MATKKSRINKELEQAIKGLIKKASDGQAIRKELLDALTLAVKWEMVKNRIEGAEGPGGEFNTLDEEDNK